MNWVLFGFKGCGKSYFARLAAQVFSLPYFDTDEWMTQESGLSPKELVALYGLERLHLFEKRAVEKAITLKGHLIATGGSTLLESKNYLLLKPSSYFIYLKAGEKALRDRWKKNPLGHDLDFDRVYFRRLPLYEKIAESVIMLESQNALKELWDIIHLDAFSKLQLGESRTAKRLEL